jgi:hypothetical protein
MTNRLGAYCARRLAASSSVSPCARSLLN